MISRIVIFSAIIYGQIFAPFITYGASVRVENQKIECCIKAKSESAKHGCCKDKSTDNNKKEQGHGKNQCENTSCHCLNFQIRSTINLFDGWAECILFSEDSRFYSISEPLIYSVYTTIWQPPKIS